VKAQSKKAAQAYQHLLDNPGAKVASVAKRFKLSVPYVYKLKARANPEAQKKDSVITLVVEETKKDVGRISEILDSRARVYGTFRDNARLAQALKRTMADHAQDLGKSFADDQWEALEMVSSKISRIVNGNADDLDQWDDIAGYATLVADRLRGLVR
jgi:hypothetical protein